MCELCSQSYEYVAGYKHEIDTRYCIDRNDVHGANCSGCKMELIEEGIDLTIPSIKLPIYVYLGRRKFKCTQSLCSKCHVEKLDDSGVRK